MTDQSATDAYLAWNRMASAAQVGWKACDDAWTASKKATEASVAAWGNLQGGSTATWEKAADEAVAFSDEAVEATLRAIDLTIRWKALSVASFEAWKVWYEKVR